MDKLTPHHLLTLALALCLAGQSSFAKYSSPRQTASLSLTIDNTSVIKHRQPWSYADMLARVTPAVVSVYSSFNTSQPGHVMFPIGVAVDQQNGLGPKKRPAALQQLSRHSFASEAKHFDVGQWLALAHAPRLLKTPAALNSTPSPSSTTPIPAGIGSGAIVTHDGYILTNGHIVIGEASQKVANNITVRLADHRDYPATVIGYDRSADIAVLKIAAQGLPFLPLSNSDKLRVGDRVFAVGNPLEVGLTVTQGIVSGVKRRNLGLLGLPNADESFIQTDAAINIGNSGGPLVDAAGRMVGVNTAIVSISGGNIGLNFSIPINLARDIAEDLVRYGVVERGFLGIRGAAINDKLAQALGLAANRTTDGVIVAYINTNSPAARAGFQKGDIILKYGQHPVHHPPGLRFLIARTEPGATIPVTIYRDKQQLQLYPVIGRRVSDFP